MINTHPTLPTRRDVLKRVARATGWGAALSLFLVPSGQGRAADAERPPRMKYAICNETFGDWPLEKAFAFAADCGYRGIEMAPFTIGDRPAEVSSTRRSEVRRLVERAGLEVVGLHWLLAKTTGFHLTTPDAQVRRQTAEYFGELARFLRRPGRQGSRPGLAPAAQPGPGHDERRRDEIRGRRPPRRVRRPSTRPAW